MSSRKARSPGGGGRDKKRMNKRSEGSYNYCKDLGFDNSWTGKPPECLEQKSVMMWWVRFTKIFILGAVEMVQWLAPLKNPCLIWFPALTWWLTTIYNCSSRESDTLFRFPWAPGTPMVYLHEYFFNCIIYLCVCVCAHAWAYPQKPKEGVRLPWS